MFKWNFSTALRLALVVTTALKTSDAARRPSAAALRRCSSKCSTGFDKVIRDLERSRFSGQLEFKIQCVEVNITQSIMTFNFLLRYRMSLPIVSTGIGEHGQLLLLGPRRARRWRNRSLH
jgi:hypothetical protein